MLITLHGLAGNPEVVGGPVRHVHPVQVPHRAVEHPLNQGPVIPMDHRVAVRDTAPARLLRKPWSLDPEAYNGLELGEALLHLVQVEVALMRRARDDHGRRPLRQRLY